MPISKLDPFLKFKFSFVYSADIHTLLVFLGKWVSAITNSNWRTVCLYLESENSGVFWQPFNMVSFQNTYSCIHKIQMLSKWSTPQASASKLLPAGLCVWNEKNRACFSVSIFLTSLEINSRSPSYLSDFVPSVTNAPSLNMPQVFPPPVFWFHPPLYTICTTTANF